jgi:hypothetical protein
MPTPVGGGWSGSSNSTGAPAKPGRTRRVHDVLRARLVPLIEDLVIETFEVEDGEILCIYIPAQPERLKPFVVDGGIVGGRHSLRVFSIVRRRGEDNASLQAQDIQTMLAVGRAVLDGVEVPSGITHGRSPGKQPSAS